MAITLGYYNINDNGNGEYRIRQKVNDDIEDNGNIHFLDNNLVAELIMQDYITPEQFGAKGDGITDDSSSFTKCFKHTLPVICCKDKVYGITHVDFNNSNIYLDGMDCTFKNIDLDMTKWASGNYAFRGISSMFADDVQNITNESKPYEKAVFKNFIVDQDCYNVIGLSEMHWGRFIYTILIMELLQYYN